MTKHYSQKDNLISIMTEISKKTPRGIMNSDTQVGHITWQMYLMRDYLKLDGTPLANASNDYSDLLSFAQDNNLIIADTTDNSLFKYNSTTDVLTLPNYIDLVLQGGNTVEEKEAGLPNIKGATAALGIGALDKQYLILDNDRYYNIQHSSGAMVLNGPNSSGYNANTISISSNSSTAILDNIVFDAHNSNSIYADTNTTVQPPAITLIPQIKYRKSTTMYEQIDAVVNYSTTEKVVGTWIDGKPLYQKTYECNELVPSENWYTTSIVSPNNIKQIVNTIAGDTNASMTYISSIANLNNSGYFGMYNTRSENVRVMYMTIQYTKTTD